MNNTISIHAVTVPNPNAIKFEVPGILLSKFPVQYNSEAEAQSSPIAKKLFGLGFVSRVFIWQNYITVTHPVNADTTWTESMADARVIVKRHLESGEALFDEMPVEVPEPELSGIAKQLKMLLDARIRPATAQDGGDITYASYENGIMKVKLAGACVECPFAPRTIKHGIEKLMKEHHPEVKEVTSDDVDWSDTAQN